VSEPYDLFYYFLNKPYPSQERLFVIEVALSPISIERLGRMEWMKNLGKSNLVMQLAESRDQLVAKEWKRG